MDEVTLDGKVYISSKRAAQITGYAKDYVGQLCREGRVEARLVGRSWYIYEQSIREHRFGHSAGSTPESEEMVVSEAKNEQIEESYDEAEDESHAEDKHEEESIAKDEVSEIQKAWQEWFEKKNKEREENYFPQASIGAKSQDEPSEKTNKYNANDEHQQTDAEVRITKIDRAYGEEKPVSQTIDIPKQETASAIEVLENTPKISTVEDNHQADEGVIRTERVIRTKKPRSYRVYKAILGSLVFLILLMTLISIGSIEAPRGPAFIFLQYISGVTTNY